MRKNIKHLVLVLVSVIMLVCMLSTSVSASFSSVTHPFTEGKSIYKSEYVNARWANPVSRNIYEKDENTFEIVEYIKDPAYTNGKISIITYDKKTFTEVKSQILNPEMPLFGGFYSGSEYNFIIVGQKNPDKSDDIVTVRIIKYTKDWKRLGHADYKANNTEIPFDAGSLSCVEHEGYLYIHTCHKMYNGHQANMSLSVKISDMTIADETSKVTNMTFAYTSHSFNQFIQVDNDRLVAVDLGDAFKRGVVITKNAFDLTDGRFVPHTAEEYMYYMPNRQLNALKIPGETGANCTGVMIGGFEIGKDNYVISISSIDHSKVTEYTSFDMKSTSGEKEERDACVVLVERDFEKKLDTKDGHNDINVKKVKLTNYVGNSKTCSVPYLVKIADNKFVVLWEEFDLPYEKYGFFTKEPWKMWYGYHTSAGVRYCLIDDQGNKLTEIKSLMAEMPVDSEVVYMDGKVVWYVNNGDVRRIYKLDVSDGSVSSVPNKPAEGVETIFKDIKKSDTFYNAVSYVYEKGLFKGVSDTEFAPDVTMTRAMFVTVIGRHAGVDVNSVSNDKSKFSDVEAGSWYAPYVEWASKTGIVNGYDNGKFGVNDKITVEQAVTMLARYLGANNLGLAGMLDSYEDSDDISNWALASLEWAVANKIYEPVNGKINPKSEASRALLATMLYNLGR